MTPPTEPAPLLDEPRTWPKVVGIISIVWAALNLLCGVCGMFSPQITMAFLPPEFQQDPLPPTMKPGLLMYTALGIGFLVALLLLVAGISLVSRKRSARGLHLAWAALACVMGAIGLYLQWSANAQMQEFMQQHPDSPWTKQQKMAGGAGQMGMIVGIVFGVVLGYAWPVFCLIWFGLVKRDSAEICAGVEESVI